MSWGSLVSYIFVLAAMFFIFAAILMATWNFTAPRLAESVDSNYERDSRFSNISYPTSMVFSILVLLVFSTSVSSTVTNYNIFNKMTDGYTMDDDYSSSSSRKRSSAYSSSVFADAALEL